MQQEGTGNHYSTNLRKQLRFPEITATPLQCRLGLDALGKQTGGANGGNWTPDRSDGGGSGADEGQGERPGVSEGGIVGGPTASEARLSIGSWDSKGF